MRILIGIILTVVASALVAACAPSPAQNDSSSTESLLTITTQIDFTQEPVQGTFEVTEGADALGCSSGTFADTLTERGVNKEFTCESGARTGTFTAEFFPPSGPWKIVAAADDFRGLSGWGAYVVILDETDLETTGDPDETDLETTGDPDETDSETTGVETFIGEIRSGS